MQDDGQKSGLCDGQAQGQQNSTTISRRQRPVRGQEQGPVVWPGLERSASRKVANRGLSDALVFKVARLGFRPFRVPNRSSGNLHLLDYLVADPPSPHPRVTDFLVGHPTVPPAYRRFSFVGSERAATSSLFFSDPAPPSRRGPQQAAAVKVLFTTARQQQNFSNTPSELAIPGYRGGINNPPVVNNLGALTKGAPIQEVL